MGRHDTRQGKARQGKMLQVEENADSTTLTALPLPMPMSFYSTYLILVFSGWAQAPLLCYSTEYYYFAVVVLSTPQPWPAIEPILVAGTSYYLSLI